MVITGVVGPCIDCFDMIEEASRSTKLGLVSGWWGDKFEVVWCCVFHKPKSYDVRIFDFIQSLLTNCDWLHKKIKYEEICKTLLTLLEYSVENGFRGQLPYINYETLDQLDKQINTNIFESTNITFVHPRSVYDRVCTKFVHCNMVLCK